MIWKGTFFSLFIWVCVRAKWISWILLLTVVWFKYKSIAFTVAHLFHVKWGAHCNFLWVQVLLAFFVHAFCLGRMQNFWALKQYLGHAQLISFCGHLQIPSAAYWVMDFCGMYLDAFLHVMPVATARPYGRSTICQYKIILFNTFWLSISIMLQLSVCSWFCKLIHTIAIMHWSFLLLLIYTSH